MRRLLILGVAVAVVVAAVVSIAAYAGGGDGDAPPAAAPAANAVTVSTQQIGDDEVLVDSSGRALYAADQETAAGRVLCGEGCTSFWEPLTVSETPTGDSVSAELDVVSRPDGDMQVTLDGKLLYTFVEDEPGEVTGDGFEDAFDGQTLTWHVVHPNGSTGSVGGGDSSGDDPFDYGQ